MAQTKHDRFLELLAREGLDPAAPARIPRRDGPRECEASYAQQGIWVNQMLDPANTAYNTLLPMRVEGPLSYAAVTQAIQTIVDRHEALRTRFRTVRGRPHQTALARLPVHVRIVDLRGREELLHPVLHDLQRTRFTLDRGPLFAFTVVRLASQVHVVAMVLHHIVFDFVSSQVLCEEFGHLYRSHTAGEPHTLSDLRIQPMDYGHWQRTRFEHSSGADVLKAWKDLLGTGDDVPAIDLAGDVPFVRDTFRPAVEPFVVPADLTADVAQLSRETGVSAFCVWLAAFQILLHRYTDAGKVVLCVPHAQRDDPDAEPLIGCLINLVVVRLRVERHASFRQVLRAVHEDYLDAIGVRACPFDKLVEVLAPTRRAGLPRLGEIAFTYQRGARSKWSIGPLDVSVLETDVANTKLALSISLYENAEECRGLLEFNAARFSREMAQQMIGHYCGLLANLVKFCDRPIGSVTHVATVSAERPNDEDTIDPRRPVDDCLHRVFERQVRATPDAPALVVGDTHLTYRGLSRRANQLARRLIREGVSIQSAVGLHVRRGIDAYLYALAIFKAGALYVPMDPSHPDAYSLENIRVADIGHLLEDNPAGAAGRSPGSHVRTLNVASMLESSRDEDDRDLDLPVSGQHIAYVYFTSGSTGDSKGVCVSHGAIASHMQAFLAALPIGSTDRVLQFAALTFDVSLEQMFSAWLSGAALLPRGDEIWSAREFINFLTQEQVTVANPPTAYWHQVVRDAVADVALRNAGLRRMIAGGEAMSPEAARRWARMSDDGIRLVNAYGPTEAVVTATCHDVSHPEACAPGMSVPIGRPLDGVIACVLDRHGLCVPAGAPGELCLAGAALSDGYLKNPRLTAEKFWPVADGLDGRGSSGRRLYRTGDRVRQLPGGALQYLSREDDEIKIRGVRVTTTRIESVLLEHESISEAAIVVRARHVPDAVTLPSSIDDESDWRDLLARLPLAFVESSIREAERDS